MAFRNQQMKLESSKKVAGSHRKTPSKKPGAVPHLTTQSAQFVKPTPSSSHGTISTAKKSFQNAAAAILTGTPALPPSSSSPVFRRTALGQLQPNLMPPATIAIASSHSSSSSALTKPVKRVFIYSIIILNSLLLSPSLSTHVFYYDYSHVTRSLVVWLRGQSRACTVRSSTRTDVDRADPRIRSATATMVIAEAAVATLVKVLRSLLLDA